MTEQEKRTIRHLFSERYHVVPRIIYSEKYKDYIVVAKVNDEDTLTAPVSFIRAMFDID